MMVASTGLSVPSLPVLEGGEVDRRRLQQVPVTPGEGWRRHRTGLLISTVTNSGGLVRFLASGWPHVVHVQRWLLGCRQVARRASPQDRARPNSRWSLRREQAAAKVVLEILIDAAAP